MKGESSSPPVAGFRLLEGRREGDLEREASTWDCEVIA